MAAAAAVAAAAAAAAAAEAAAAEAAAAEDRIRAMMIEVDACSADLGWWPKLWHDLS